MTDHEKRIREALEAGPTEGEWLTDKRDPRFVYALNVEGYNQFWAHVHGHNTRTVELEANAHLIAACNPTALRALLADLDDARAALTAAKAGGWVAVPVEPTPEMLKAGHGSISCVGSCGEASPPEVSDFCDVWTAMLAARLLPTPPKEQA